MDTVGKSNIFYFLASLVLHHVEYQIQPTKIIPTPFSFTAPNI